MRFVIGAFDYGDQSCGVRALNRLCHWLNVHGHEAYLGGTARWQRPVKVHPEWDVRAWDGTMTDDTIAVYPDAYSHNIYEARRIVRWCLYHPGLRGGQPTFSPTERVYYYASIFEDSVRDAAAPMGVSRLHVSVFEPHVLYLDKKPKLYDAFWIGRGTPSMQWLEAIGYSSMYEFQHPFPTRLAFADALRRVRKFYCFDPCSAMVPEAKLCGAQVFLVDHLAAREPHLDHIREIRYNSPEMLDACDHDFNRDGDAALFMQDMQAWR